MGECGCSPTHQVKRHGDRLLPKEVPLGGVEGQHAQRAEVNVNAFAVGGRRRRGVHVGGHDDRQRTGFEFLSPQLGPRGCVETKDAEFFFPDKCRGEDASAGHHGAGDPLADLGLPENVFVGGEFDGEIFAVGGNARCIGAAELGPILAPRRADTQRKTQHEGNRHDAGRTTQADRSAVGPTAQPSAWEERRLFVA